MYASFKRRYLPEQLFQFYPNEQIRCVNQTIYIGIVVFMKLKQNKQTIAMVWLSDCHGLFNCLFIRHGLDTKTNICVSDQ